MLVNLDRSRRWLSAVARWVLVNLDRARPWLIGIGRWLLACASWIMNKTERPRRWIAVRSRPVLARLAGPLGRLAVPGRWVLAQVDRVQQWMPDISRRGILGLLLVAQLAWPAAFHSVSEVAAQPAKAPVVSAPAPGTPQAAPAPAAPAVAGKAPAPAVQAPVAAPSPAQLMPDGMPIGQSTFIPTTVQMGNARAIVQTGQQLNLPPRAWVIAVATSLQETKLINYGDLGGANDHDSLGLFQQRPSSGWGTPDELTNPHYAASAFYNALVEVPGWQNLPLTVAAQDVQVSAFGDRYAQWEKQATDMVLAQYGIGPYWGVSAG
ncbi:hypothetical protein [Rugosimonospora africana]|uniref:Transglycosylase SLT domain-containing protein n=1 Tax=Rugosimonospora africana TaxID=556532 RepID=A0A8J3QXH3_9ACTN|nr:hypothetical protein [Rugosimonospora africana]GIH17932.1 hypothetical protein Raf01_61040 [Rugosimonospora africana]